MNRIKNLPELFVHHAATLLADESGATAIEYALLAGGVAVAVATAVTNLGSTVNTMLFGKVANVMQ